MNVHTIIGNVGQDPETKKFENGQITKISIASDESYKDKEGNKVDKVEWHNCECNTKLAQVIEKYVKKGDKIMVSGPVVTDKWQDEQGNNRSRRKTKILQMEMLGSPKGQSEQSQQPEQPQSDNSGGGEGEGAKDELPFRRTPYKMMFKNKWF